MNCMIYNIQRFSTHDGPGIRTTVFFKGCTLKCEWCHNPESISFNKELQYLEEHCINCGHCAAVCTAKAHQMDPNGCHVFDRTRCTNCFACTEVCFADALKSIGTEKTDAETFRSLLTDLEYYKTSGGGVTFSGGESMVQIDCLSELLKLCHEAGIHTAVDTAGNVAWSSFEQIIPYVDLFLYDIKTYDSDLHKKLTGSDNTRILDNLRKLSSLNKRIHIRIPFIPGLNDLEMSNIADFLSDMNIEKIDLLPYNRLGEGKHISIGKAAQINHFSTPTKDQIQTAVSSLKTSGIPVYTDF